MPGPGDRPRAPADPGVAVAAATRSLTDALAVFARFGSPRVLLAGLTLASGARLVAAAGAAPFTAWDGVALVVVAALVPFVEWFVHLVVLHARPRRIGGLVLDPGAGHREHHANPASVDRVLLRPIDAGLFQVINAGLVVVVVGLPLLLAGRPALGPTLTGVVVAVAALAHYEWAHFLFHVAYRPRTARYRRLKANHRRHHWRDERRGLGITSGLADRVLGTRP